MSFYHPLTHDHDSASSDGFEQLPQNLQQYGPNLSQNYDRSERETSLNTYDFETDFSQWQLNRFGRKSTVNIWNFISQSFYCTIRNFYYLLIFYIIIIAITFILFKLNLSLIFVPFIAFTRLFKTGISISLILNEKWNSRLYLLFTKSALMTFLIELIPSFFIYECCISLFNRSSTVTFLSLLLLISTYFAFFIPCFVFETKPLPFSSLVSFSLNVSLFSPQPVHILTIFFISFIFQLLGPLSLGLTDWMGQIIKPSVFFAVCGSAINPGSNSSLL